MHESAHFSFIFSLQRGHNRPSPRIIWHAVQKSLRISFFFWGSLMRKCVILSMISCTAGRFSSEIRLPLPLLRYRLTADCDRPRMLATCCSFIPCFSTMFFAIRAFTAGKTVLTPVSHGNSTFSPLLLISTGNVYKYVACHVFYDACHDWADFKNTNCTQSPTRFTRQGPRQN